MRQRKGNNKATHKIGVVLTDEHYARFLRLSEAMQRTPSDTLRRLVLDGYETFFSGRKMCHSTQEAK